MKKILIPVFVIFLIMTAAGIYYFNAVFLPKTLNTIISGKAQEFLGRGIAYDSIEYHFGQGLIISGLKISQKSDPSLILFKADRVFSNIPIIPLIKERKIILPEINVDHFETTLIRLDLKTWNISDLLSIKKSNDEKSFDVLLGKIYLTNGRAVLQDQQRLFETKTIDIAHLKASLSLPDKINVAFLGKSNTGSTADIKGAYMILKKSVELNAILSDIDLVQELFPFVNINFKPDQAFIKKAAIATSYANETLELRGDALFGTTLITNDLFIAGNFESSGSHVVWNNNQLSIDINLLTSPDSLIQFDKKVDFNGSFSVSNVRLTDEDNKFSFGGDIKAAPSRLTISGLTISGPEIIANEFLFQKETPPDLFKEIKLSTSLSYPSANLNFNNLTITGDLDIPKIELSILDDVLTMTTSLITLNQASITSSHSIILKGDFKSNFLNINANKDLVNISGYAETDLLSFALPENRTGSVTPSLTYKIYYDRTKLDGLTYDITADLLKGTVNNVSSDIPTIEGIRGKARVINDNIELADLLGTFDKTTFSVNGRLKTFNKFIADLVIKAKDISVMSWLPMIKPLIDPYEVTLENGTADIDLIVRGALVPPEKPQLAVEATLKNVQASSSKWPDPFQRINGYLKYEENFLSWENLNFEFKKERWESTGNLKQFRAPIINAKLEAPDLFLSVNAQSIDGAYEISRGDIKTKLSYLTGSGKFTPNPQNPYLELKARGQITLSDLKRIPFLKPKLEEWKAIGKADVDLIFLGSTNAPADAKFSFKYQSDRTLLKSLRFDNLYVKLDQAAPRALAFDAASSFYDGKLSTAGKIVTKDLFPLTLQFYATAINLAALKDDLPVIDQRQLGGSLSLDLYMEGPVKKTDKITGQGKVSVINGYLTKSKLLKGMLALILNNYEGTIFTDGKSKLFIRDNRLKLQDIYLRSSDVDLTGYGWIDINKKIDFTIAPNFKNSLSIKSSLLKTGTEDIIEKYLSIRITGALNQPKYSSSIDSTSVVQDAADAISNGVHGLIKGLGF